MKVVKVIWYGEENCDNILIETFQDVLEYQQHLSNNTSDTFYRMINDKIPMSRWDHYGVEGQYGNSFNLAVQKCKIFGGRPILEFDKITNEKCMSILSQIYKGNKVLINKAGGWCPFTEDIHKILDVQEYSPTSNRKVVIKDNTKYINLENDPQLEKRTIEYLSGLDTNYSYILRLCEYSKEELVDIFKEFLSKGGSTVYVYTTGSNVTQMWEYSKSLVISGIKKVEFEFNSGYDEDHKAVVEYLETNNVEVSLINC